MLKGMAILGSFSGYYLRSPAPGAARAQQSAQNRSRLEPRNGKGAAGISSVMVTCPDCLKSFPLDVEKEYVEQVQETSCLFCTKIVRYVIDFSVIAPHDAARRIHSGTKAASNGA